MRHQNFDRLLSEIRNEHVNDQVVSQAGERIWNLIAGSQTSDLRTFKLGSCQDFQALIPAYLEKRLPEARTLLFEDHVHECVACRRALDQARRGEMQTVGRLGLAPRRFLAWRWVIGTTGVVALGIALVALANGFFHGQYPVRGAVQNVDGSLYSVSDQRVRLIASGYQIRNGDQIRTAKGSNAVVRLLDGSLIEMGERSDISVSRGWKGTTIYLDGGQIIVQATKQRTGSLYVATDDCLVAVKGTIFSVNRGTKGSRVSVIEGVVKVDYGQRTAELHAGDEATTSARISKIPIQDEIAWSKNAAKYLALLGDLAVLEKQFEAIPGAGLRFSSDLLQYAPDNTVIYAAIPNLASTLNEASRLFQERLDESPALRSWWREQQAGSGPKLEDMIDQLKTFSSYLGDEIVYAVAKNGPSFAGPVVLARVRQPGLATFLENQNRQLQRSGPHLMLQIVSNPWGVLAYPGQPLLVYLNHDMLVASPDLGEVQRVASEVEQSRASRFAKTQLYQHILRSYEGGVGWLFSMDMEQLVAQDVHEGRDQGLLPGISDVKYLTMERREVAGKTENRAALTFASDRQGVASWLAAPAPMGSLEFVSPDASMVTSAVIKNPRSILEEVFQMIGSGDPSFSRQLSDFESKTGVSVLDDITAPVGGELTMAFDGPLLPTPRWKLVFEVYDPATLQSAIAKLVESFNRGGNGAYASLWLGKRQVNSQTYFILRDQRRGNYEIDYTFLDSYLIAAPDLGTLARAIQDRQTGHTLTHSSTFQTLLPSDGYTNFSAIFYHNLGPVVGPLAEQLKATGTLTSAQRQSIDSLTTNTAPGLIYAYGEPSRIVVASNTGFMGFDLATLMTIADGGPFLPQIWLGRTLENDSASTPTQ